MSELKDISKLLNLQEWNVLSFTEDFENNSIIFNVSKPSELCCECSYCNNKELFGFDKAPVRKVQDLPAFGKKVFISFSPSRIKCSCCNRITVEKISWIESYSRITLRYEKYLASYCDYMPVVDVSEIEGINKDTLYRLDKKWLAWRKENRCFTGPVKLLGIDEIAIRKNHKYATVFYDLERSMVIGLVKGRKQRNVSSFFRKWGKDNCKNVTAVCTDLWSAFHNSVKIHLKKATLVFDKFHVYKYLSDAIEQVRRDEQNKLEEEEKKTLKGFRWILLKTELKTKDKKKLEELMKINESIHKAMILKEEFRRFYEAKDQETAEKILLDWIDECNESKLKPFIKLAKRLNRWKNGLLEYFKQKISNGISEGLNNKIKVIKRKSYGFHDMEYFFLKILMATGFLPYMRKL